MLSRGAVAKTSTVSTALLLATFLTLVETVVVALDVTEAEVPLYWKLPAPPYDSPAPKANSGVEGAST